LALAAAAIVAVAGVTFVVASKAGIGWSGGVRTTPPTSSGMASSDTASGQPSTPPPVPRDRLLVDSAVPIACWGTIGDDRHVAVTDVTGDGKPDVVQLRVTADSTEIRLWYGTVAPDTPGALVRRLDHPLRGVQVAGGDVNGDGHGDLVVYHRATNGSAEVAVWRGNRDGFWDPLVVFTNSGFMASARMAVTDVTGDGTGDIVLARAAGDATELHLITGGRTVAGLGVKVGRLGRPLATMEIAAADVTGDGHGDILMRARDASGLGELYVAEGNTTGLWETIRMPMAASRIHAASAVVATDVNGDRIADAVLGQATPGGVELYVIAGGELHGPDRFLRTVATARLG